MGKNREEERRVGSDGVLIATPAQTTSTARGTIETRVAGSFGNVAQCLVFFVGRCSLSAREGFAAAAPSPHPPSFRWLCIPESPNLAFVT